MGDAKPSRERPPALPDETWRGTRRRGPMRTTRAPPCPRPGSRGPRRRRGNAPSPRGDVDCGRSVPGCRIPSRGPRRIRRCAPPFRAHRERLPERLPATGEGSDASSISKKGQVRTGSSPPRRSGNRVSRGNAPPPPSCSTGRRGEGRTASRPAWSFPGADAVHQPFLRSGSPAIQGPGNNRNIVTDHRSGSVPVRPFP